MTGRKGRANDRGVRALALLLLALPSACAGVCPNGRVCGAASWRGAAVDGAMRVLAVAEVDDDAPEISVTPRGAQLRFALDPQMALGRAVLSVRETVGSRRRGGTTLRARALLGAWAAGELPRTSATAGASLAAEVRGPIRLDVTEALRECLAWGACAGLALETDGAEVRLAGPWDAQGAPRLEVAAP